MDSLPLSPQGSPQGQGQCLNLSSIPTPDPVHASDTVLVYSWWMNEILNKQNELMKAVHPINERSRLYNKLIQNDSEIKRYLMNEVIYNEE